MREETPPDGIPQEDLLFAQLAVSQGIATREKVEECLSSLRNLAQAGVRPLPRLGELLQKKGYLLQERADLTQKASSREGTGGPRPARAPEMPPEAEEAAKDPSTLVGKFVRVARLGSGGMGEVWKAWDRELRRWVAMKFLKGDDRDEVSRFRREAQMSARLNHPNICGVYEVSEPGSRPYIAMQFVDGETLATFPRSDVRMLLRLVRDAALAVHYAHEQGVIHRDLKPHNIMVEGRRDAEKKTSRAVPGQASSHGFRVYVMDFGLAKQAAVDSSISVSGAVLGTPAYMSPEQARGNAPLVDARSDIYSLGATLYTVLAGRAPHEGVDVVERLLGAATEEPAAPRKLNPSIPREVETIVLKAMETERERRYASALELAEDLDRYLDGEPIRARRAGLAYRIGKKLAKHRGIAIAAGVAAAALLAVGGYALHRSGQVKRLGEDKAKLDEADRRRRLAKTDFDQGMERFRALERLLSSQERREEEAKRLAGEAVGSFRKALEIYPGYGEAALQIARVRLEEKESQEARQWGSRAAEISPELATAFLLRALIDLEQYENLRHHSGGEVRPATPEATRLGSLIEDDLKRVAKDHKDIAELEYAQGLLLFADGRYAEAGDAFEKYLARVPGDWRAEEWCAHADMHAGRRDRQIAHAGKAIELRPWKGSLYGLRGDALQATGERDRAIEDFSKAIERDPAYAAAYLDRRGVARREKGDSDRAIEDLTKAIDLDPRVAAFYGNRGNAFQSKGDYVHAVDDYTKAIELDPKFMPAYFNRGMMRLSLAEREPERAREHLKAVMEDLKKTLELHPADGRIEEQAGSALSKAIESLLKLEKAGKP